MAQAVKFNVEPVVINKEIVLTEPYLNVMHIYFINLSAFRRFVVNKRTRKELKYKIKSLTLRNNELFSLQRSPLQLQADNLTLIKMAETLRNNDGL
ncbi:hypothetical protein [Shewanella algicola]|uniref:hypothetical protein n=1 Tax=Shewanella algicola TaxID=640633 RepID=UPI0024959524|nr:hypothetical protein [Shewanella algicola]